MSTLKIKNSNYNPLFSLMRQHKINFEVKKTEGNMQTIQFFPVTKTLKAELMNVLSNYGTREYHDTVLGVEFSLKGKFNYLSNQYENMVSNDTELELPLYYVENINEQNKRLQNLKAINSNVIGKSYMKTIMNSQRTLRKKTQNDLHRMRNIYFGKDFEKVRSKNFLDEFPYYNTIQIDALDNNEFVSKMLNRLDFYEELLEDLIKPKLALSTNLLINNTEEKTIDTYDLYETIKQSQAIIDETNKVILSKTVKDKNYASNNFKKFLLLNYLDDRDKGLVKTFSQMYENELCEKEYIIYRIEKYRKEETRPIQVFWIHDESFKDFYDYQIKLNISYRYSVKAYSIIYGTSSRITNIREALPNSRNTLNLVKADVTCSPSYRIAILDFGEISLKNIPNPPMAPHAHFYNETSSENIVKIYLDLKNGSKTEEFINITEKDSTLIQNIETNQSGEINFKYLLEDGKFEVYRTTEKPKTFADFEDAKILDVRNKYSSTSAIFKDTITPNKKYYYMFRAVNLVGTPSNPTPVYEVELIKDASSSKVVVSTIEFEKENKFYDKHFKSLLQISPSFHQEIFDDQSENVQKLSSFDKKINDLSLGTATDKVWGKKFKIRVKSKDTGKIVDLNVKFNLIKDNIK